MKTTIFIGIGMGLSSTASSVLTSYQNTALASIGFSNPNNGRTNGEGFPGAA